MRHAIRFVGALSGVGIAAVSLAVPEPARADMIAPDVANRGRGLDEVANSRRCPARKPAYGAPCGAAMRDLVCRYQTAGATSTSYRCAASAGSAVLWWQTNQTVTQRHRSMPVPGPLPPPELAA